jgi:DNA-directed RNA polymerase subunit omega
MNMEKFDSKYRYILVAARRARQLQGGAPALVTSQSRKASKIAQDELTAGLVNYVVENKSKAPVVAPTDVYDGGSH